MKQKSPTGANLIASPDHYTRDFRGLITRSQQEKVDAIISNFMRDIRRILKEITPHTKDAGICATCACAPVSEKMKGHRETAYGFLWAICNRKLFVCHEMQPTWKTNKIDPKKFMVCSSFLLIVGERADEVLEVARRAMTDINMAVST